MTSSLTTTTIRKETIPSPEKGLRSQSIMMSLIGCRVVCTMSDERKVRGIFVCVDRLKNLILTDCIEERMIYASDYYRDDYNDDDNNDNDNINDDDHDEMKRNKQQQQEQSQEQGAADGRSEARSSITDEGRNGIKGEVALDQHVKKKKSSRGDVSKVATRYLQQAMIPGQHLVRVTIDRPTFVGRVVNVIGEDALRMDYPERYRTSTSTSTSTSTTPRTKKEQSS